MVCLRTNHDINQTYTFRRGSGVLRVAIAYKIIQTSSDNARSSGIIIISIDLAANAPAMVKIDDAHAYWKRGEKTPAPDGNRQKGFHQYRAENYHKRKIRRCVRVCIRSRVYTYQNIQGGLFFTCSPLFLK